MSAEVLLAIVTGVLALLSAGILALLNGWISEAWVPRNSGRLEHRLRVWAGEMAG
jgi:hypothetical protein